MKDCVILVLALIPIFVMIAFKNPFMILLGIVWFVVFASLYYFMIIKRRKKEEMK